MDAYACGCVRCAITLDPVAAEAQATAQASGGGAARAFAQASASSSAVNNCLRGNTAQATAIAQAEARSFGGSTALAQASANASGDDDSDESSLPACHGCWHIYTGDCKWESEEPCRQCIMACSCFALGNATCTLDISRACENIVSHGRSLMSAFECSMLWHVPISKFGWLCPLSYLAAVV